MNKYIYIIVDHTQIESDLTDFPLLINLSTASGLTDTDVSNIFTVLGENKYKIKLKDTNDIEHYIEIETWDSVNNKAVLHTKVNLSSSVNSIFRLYYDSEFVDNTSYIGVTGSTSARNVWDSNYKAVYTMAQNPSIGGACILDSTVNANHGTPYGSMTNSDLVDGLIGKALNFDGVNDYIIIDTNSSLVPINPNITVEIMSYGTKSTANAIIAQRATCSNSFNWQIYGIVESGFGLYADIKSSTQLNKEILTSYSIKDDWHTPSFTYNGSIFKLLDNGTIVSSINSTFAVSTLSIQTIIGQESCGNHFAGKIESIRISNIARSDDWISATNKSLRDELCSFYQIGSNDFLFEEGAGVITLSNQAHFNFLPDEDYHILTLSASLPMPTLEMTGTSSLPPYNAINLNLPMLTCEMEGDSWRGAIGDTYGDIAFDLPMLECVMYSGGAVMEFDLPMLICEMTTLPDPIYAQIDITLPMLTCEMNQIDPISASLNITLPMMTALMTGDATFTQMSFSLPMMEMVAYTGASMTIALPMMEIEMTAGTAKSMSINAMFPMPEIVMYSGSTINLDLPMLEASLTGDAENISTMSATLPMIGCLFEGNNSYPANIQAILPMMSLSMSSAGNRYNEIIAALPLLEIEMNCINQGVSSIDAMFPMLSAFMTGQSYRAGGNYIEIDLPMMEMAGSISSPASSEILRHVRGKER